MCTSLPGCPADGRVCLGTLAADAELLNQFEIRVRVFGSDVLQVALALTDHLEQAAAGGKILFVSLEVLGQLFDTLGQNPYLYAGATGVVFAGLQVFNDCLLLLT